MARGWESKAVESQIEEAESRPAHGPKPPPDPAQMERLRTRESLQLARKRVLHDLETSHSFRMEQTLRASLKHLDEKIEELK
jgi:hypothetical protein